jgi:hypothetical protein
MRAAIFNHIGSRGYFWYLLFQVFTVDAVDGTHHAFGQHPIKSMVIGNKGAFIPYPNHSQINYMGPSVQMCMLDCRAERKLDQINTEETYDKVFSLLYTLPASTEQLIMLLGGYLSDRKSELEPGSKSRFLLPRCPDRLPANVYRGERFVE